MAIKGIIRPPPDIRVVADRTAMFVAKNGRAFESRILNSAKGKTPKFAFLQTTSPFHAYYEDRIRHFEEGGGAETDDKKKKEGESSGEAKPQASTGAEASGKTNAGAGASEQQTTQPKDKVTKQKASVMDPVARAILRQRSVITNHLKKEREKRKTTAAETDGGGADADSNSNSNPNADPSGSNHSGPLPLPAPPKPLDAVKVVAPYHLTPTQIETIQLVAQFVAMDGKGGPFLPALVNREWANPAFAFCQPRNVHFAYFSALVDAYRVILSEYTAAAEGKPKPDTNESPPGPTAPNGGSTPEDVLNDAAYRTEYERELERRRQKQQENPGAMEDGEIANAIDWHDFVVVETIDFPIGEDVDAGLSMLPATTGTTTVGPLSARAAEAPGGGNDMEESSDEDDEEGNIRVVPSYTPRVVGAFDPSTARAVDPLTGKSVSVADMPEHMRIQLLDPKWAEERKKFRDKQKDSNLVGGDAVVANIARLAAREQGAAAAAVAPLPAAGPHRQGVAPAASAIGPASAGRPEPPAGTTPSKRFHAAPAGHGAEPPPPKRPRAVELPQQHKVTVAPPLVTRAPPVLPTDQQATGATMAPSLSAAAPPAADAANPSGTDPPPPPAKEQKLLPADEFIATLAGPKVELQIRVPNDSAQQNWNFFGQTLTLEGIDVTSIVKDVKAVLSKTHLNGMPPNKIQLKSVGGAGKFLNNNTSLAALNIGPTALLELKTKLRGGGRK